jgi:putative methionine-R-sulfoxide reductase with GAF domain/HAMP domain-containing protein
MRKAEPSAPQTTQLHEERRERRVRRLFNAFLALTVLAYLASVYLGYLGNSTINLVGSANTRMILGIGLVAFVLGHGLVPRLAKTVQLLSACLIVVGGMWYVSYQFMIGTDELGRVSTLITALIGVMLVTQAVPRRYIPHSLGFIAAGTLILTLVDLYWPVPRTLLDEQTRVAVYGIVVLASVLMVSIVLRDFQDYSLRAKLVGTTLFLTLVIVGVTTYAVGVVIRQTVGGQAEERLHVLTQSQALALGELLARQVNTLQTLTFNSAIQTATASQSASYAGSREDIEATLLDTDFRWLRASDTNPLIQQKMDNEITEELLKYTTAFPENAELFITDRYGALVAMTQRTTDYYQADEEWWIEAYNSGFGGIFVATPEYDRSTDVLGIAIAVPIFSQPASGQAKEFVGVMRTTYRIDALVDFLGQTDIGENNRLDLYFDDGTLLRVVDGVVEFQRAPLLPDEIEALLPLPESVVSFNYDGITSLVTRYPVSTLTSEEFVTNLNWYMVSSQAESETFATVTVQQRTNILLGIAAVIVGGVAAAIVGQVLTAPIVRLTDAAAQVTRGNLQTRVLVQNRDEIGLLSESFNQMTDQLLDAITNLELRVADRTRALSISTEVGRRLSTILDRQQLVQETVDQIRDGFNYYHAHMYLFDEKKESLLLVGGTGNAGKEMMAQGHQIKAEQGLVGRAAATNLPIIVPDVAREPGWLANPLLPDTKAEIAVPIAVGNEIIGVLDVQHNIVNGLQQQDADLLLSIANQVAIALQNTRLLEETHNRAEDLTQITQIKEKIQQTTSIESALQVAVRELGRVTKARATTVKLQTNGREDHD